MKKGLTLMVKAPIRKLPKVPFGQWDFKWATDTEVNEFKNQGYVKCKELK